MPQGGGGRQLKEPGPSCVGALKECPKSVDPTSPGMETHPRSLRTLTLPVALVLGLLALPIFLRGPDSVPADAPQEQAAEVPDAEGPATWERMEESLVQYRAALEALGR